MRRSRIYTAQTLKLGQTIGLDRRASHYLARVLRLKPGNALVLFNGDGSDYVSEVCEIQRDRIAVKITGRQEPGTESVLRITLVQAISRGERMDYSLQKATELGVSDIQPVTSQRVEVRLDQQKQTKRLAHWPGVVVSACEQSGRARVPEVRPVLPIEHWLQTRDENQSLLLDPMSRVKLSGVKLAGSSIDILVGPEGGFTDQEMEQLRDGRVMPVSLGPRILRTETAGPAAIAVIQAIAGDI